MHSQIDSQFSSIHEYKYGWVQFAQQSDPCRIYSRICFFSASNGLCCRHGRKVGLGISAVSRCARSFLFHLSSLGAVCDRSVLVHNFAEVQSLALTGLLADSGYHHLVKRDPTRLAQTRRQGYLPLPLPFDPLRRAPEGSLGCISLIRRH